jgi:hypothetical protein
MMPTNFYLQKMIIGNTIDGVIEKVVIRKSEKKKKTTLARFELTLPRELDFKSNAITCSILV